GPVGFGEVIKQPNLVPHNWQVDHFVLQVAKKLGADVEVPSQHSEFVALGPGGLIGNVYTMYFGYMDWGLTGMMLLLFVAGLVITVIFRHALVNPRTPVLVYTILFIQTTLSVFSENFYRGVGTTLRMFLFAWTIYNAPAWLQRFRRVMAQAASAHLRQTELPPLP
ncbi:MAG: O-antigen polymerase, partial [Candidatus Angelobacter sp.]